MNSGDGIPCDLRRRPGPPSGQSSTPICQLKTLPGFVGARAGFPIVDRRILRGRHPGLRVTEAPFGNTGRGSGAAPAGALPCRRLAGRSWRAAAKVAAKAEIDLAADAGSLSYEGIEGEPVDIRTWWEAHCFATSAQTRGGPS